MLKYDIDCIDEIITQTFLIFDLHSKEDIKIFAIHQDSCIIEQDDDWLESDGSEGSGHVDNSDYEGSIHSFLSDTVDNCDDKTDDISSDESYIEEYETTSESDEDEEC